MSHSTQYLTIRARRLSELLRQVHPEGECSAKRATGEWCDRCRPLADEAVDLIDQSPRWAVIIATIMAVVQRLRRRDPHPFRPLGSIYRSSSGRDAA